MLHDAGVGEDIDSAIRAVSSKGSVSGISIFPKSKTTNAMMRFAESNGIAVGAHLSPPFCRKAAYGKEKTILAICRDHLKSFRDNLGRSPDYYDSHCFVLRCVPSLYGELSSEFGIVPMIQADDPYSGAAYRIAGRLHAHSVPTARSKLAPLLGLGGFVMSHVSMGGKNSWSCCFRALMDADIKAVQKAMWPSSSLQIGRSCVNA